MYLTYTRHTVKNYDVWKKAFDENSSMLAKRGITWEIVQINGVAIDVAVICRCETQAQWDAFVAEDQEKSRRTGIDPRIKGGLIGDPEWWAGEVM